MELDTKKKAHNAFWSGERRCLISVGGGTWEAPPYTDLTQKWLDPQYRVDCIEHLLTQQWYGCDCIPHVFVNFGPGVLAACIGGSYELSETTVWFEKHPVINSWSKKPEFILNINAPIYQSIFTTTQILLNNAKDRYIVSRSDWGGIFDNLCSLRGTMTLLSDLYEAPEDVLLASEQVTKQWLEVSTLNNEQFASQGYTDWIPLYSSKPYAVVQSDFSVMISPEMFDQFLLPCIINQVNSLTYSIFHLDGEGCIRHLDSLLNIKKLSGIQYVPSNFNHPNPGDASYFPLYERILSSGKKLALTGVAPHLIQQLYQALPGGEIYANTWETDILKAQRLDDAMEKYRI